MTTGRGSPELEIDNVYIFASDSLRWDYLPDSVADRGVVAKTVAASLSSPPSFSSLATGRHPPEHGVYQWNDTIADEIPRIFDIDGVDSGFFNEGDPEEIQMLSVLGVENTPVCDLSPPFIHLHRDPGAHQPLGDTDSAKEYYDTWQDDWDTYRRDYASAVDESINRFDRQLQGLADRGILEDTLVIFTSDHGELIGEHGCVGHNEPATPELVYVPSVFIHPDLSEDEFEADLSDTVIEHVDIIGTAIEAMGEKGFNTSGVNLLRDDRNRDWGYNYFDILKRGHRVYEAESLWWFDGGHVFARNGRLKRIVYALSRLAFGHEREAIRRQTTRYLRTFAEESITYGNPPESTEKAREVLSAFESELDEGTARRRAITEESRERLENLGYLN